MDEIKKILTKDIETINQSIVEVQMDIDKCFNDMLDFIPGTDEYIKAKVDHDCKCQEKWLYYGWIGAIKKMLNLINKQEQVDKLNEDIEAFDYFESVGAEELPF